MYHDLILSSTVIFLYVYAAYLAWSCEKMAKAINDNARILNQLRDYVLKHPSYLDNISPSGEKNEIS